MNTIRKVKRKTDPKNFVRGNENLKAPDVVEYVPKKEYKRRAKELLKCKNDPIYFAENYFYIINPEKGKHIIELYPKQKDLIRTMCNEDRIVVLASRQVGKTTAYNIFALWLCMFHPEQSVLICANTGDSASDFVSRIRMAYELIPMWLKPGVKEWNKRQLLFANDSKIAASPTSPGVRGKTGNVLILDEFAFVDPAIEKEFWEGVYPVVSSAKGTKVIMVSTPNGTGNIYYETYDRATMGIGDDGWIPFRIDWFEVPGRDEKWKKKQIASLNGDMRAWAQEFGNTFFGSSQTLIEGKYIRDFKEIVLAQQEQGLEPIKQNMGNGDDIFNINVWHQPKENCTYIIGADGGEGIGGDFSTMLCFEITDLSKITLTASYGSNEISTREFAYLLVKTAKKYRNAFIAIENNGITKSIVDDIWGLYEYDNMINIGKVGKIGIFSTHNVKVDACLFLKSLIQTSEIRFDLREPILVSEMEYFERKEGLRPIFCAAGTKHDDYMMAFVWAMYILNSARIEDYYQVTKWMTTEFGITMPQRIHSYDNFSAAVTTPEAVDKKFGDLFGPSVDAISTDGSREIKAAPTADDELVNLGFLGDNVDEYFY